MMGLRRVVFACVLAVPVAVAAQPSSANKQQAQDLVKKAIAKSQSGDHLAAIDLYLDAYRLVPLAQLLSNIGTEYQSAQKPVEALRYFCKYLDAEPTGALSTYANAQAKVLQMQLTSQQSGDPCKPQAAAKDDSEKPDTKPKPDPKIAQVTAPIGETKEGTVSSNGGSTIKVVGLGSIAVGAVVLGVGGYFGYRAKHYSDEITNHDPSQPWPDTIKQDEADGKSAQTKQIAFMVAGGAIAATGVVLYLVGRSKTPEEQHASARSKPRPWAVVTPAAAPDSVGLVVSGGF